MVWFSCLAKSSSQFVMTLIVKGFSVVDEAEIDVFLKFLCFLYNPANVGNSSPKPLAEENMLKWTKEGGINGSEF